MYIYEQHAAMASLSTLIRAPFQVILLPFKAVQLISDIVGLFFKAICLYIVTVILIKAFEILIDGDPAGDILTTIYAEELIAALIVDGAVIIVLMLLILLYECIHTPTSSTPAQVAAPPPKKTRAGLVCWDFWPWEWIAQNGYDDEDDEEITVHVNQMQHM